MDITSTIQSSSLSDKDCQQFSKTYRRNCQIYYENTEKHEIVHDLINLTAIIPQIIKTKKDANALNILSQMEILKAKTKSEPQLGEYIEKAAKHLRTPLISQLNPSLLLELIKSKEVFTVGCLVYIRFFKDIVDKSNQLKKGLDMDSLIISIGVNFTTNMALSIELLQLILSDYEQSCSLAVKQGIPRSIFLNYIPQIISKDKFSLYKCIKLIKTVAKMQKTIIKQREKIMVNIIYLYEEYIPIVTDICDKCFDHAYCAEFNKASLEIIDQMYLWSYSQTYCHQILTQKLIDSFSITLESKLLPQIQAKIYAIIGNYYKYSKYLQLQLLKNVPKHQQSLLNYIKLCLIILQLDHNSSKLIDWIQLEKMMVLNSNGKAHQLYKYLKSMINRQVKVGVLNPNLKSVFATEKGSDLYNQKVTKIPKNNQELQDIRHILKQKPSNNQFDRDNLQMLKQKSLQTLRLAISQDHKLSLKTIIDQWQLNNVQLLNKFFQVLEVNLLMNEKDIDEVDLDKILKMIHWLEQNYQGEIVDWGSISQVLMMLLNEREWMDHLKEIPSKCFWILAVEQMSQEDQKELISVAKNAKLSNIKKLSVMIGFFGKVMQNTSKFQLMKQCPQIFTALINQVKSGKNYKLNLINLSYFLKGWQLQAEQDNYKQNNRQFQKLIKPLVQIVVTSYKGLPQQHYFLQSCLPFDICPHSLTENIDQLVITHGQLAAYIYKNMPKNKKSLINPEKLPPLSNLEPRNLHQILKFLQKNPQLTKLDEFKKIVRRINENENIFWKLYPHFVGIESLILGIISEGNESIKPCLTQSIISALNNIENNKNITKQQRQDLLYEVKDSLENLKNKGVYIQIESIRKYVTRIIQEEVREQIIIILNSYIIKEDAPKQAKNQFKEHPILKKIQQINIEKVVQNKSSQKQKQPIKMQSYQAQLLKQEANLTEFINNSIQETHQQWVKQEPSQPIQLQFQSVKINSKQQTLYLALQLLNKIINRQQKQQKFDQIYPILTNSHPTDSQKELLGVLLSKYYKMFQDQRALTLFLDKEKTSLEKQPFQQLIKNYKRAFILVRRWRIQSRQGLDLAMVRIKQGFVNDACIVANYNLAKVSQIQYFYTKKYHTILIEIFPKLLTQEQIANYLRLIGTLSKFPQIKAEFIAKKMHLKIVIFSKMFSNSILVISSLCYALASLIYQSPQSCKEIINQKQQLFIIYQFAKKQKTNRTVVEPFVCLIANLSYSTPQIKEILRERKTIGLLLTLFDANLIQHENSTYKQLLRSLGNLSISKLCSEEIIDGHFCDMAVRMAQALEFLSCYDDRKARIMKLLIDLLANLAVHKSKLELMHKQKVTLLVITLLQITQKDVEVLKGCLDTIDALCQNPEIELFFVEQKRLPFIIMDILKLQQHTIIILKATRLVSNLTIHAQCITSILVSNLMSVMGNVVIPNLNIGLMSPDLIKSIEGYILKSLSRIHLAKPNIKQVMKSGYLDCLVRTIEMIEVEDGHLEILFFYSQYLPNFLNKRAFSCIIKILTKKINNKAILEECIKSLKNLLTFSYDREDEEEVIDGIFEMYQRFLTSQFPKDALFLLIYHLLRSHPLRKSLVKKGGKVFEIVQNLSKQQAYTQFCKTVLFLSYNHFNPLCLSISQHESQQQLYNELRMGFKCKLYRSDGTHKHAKLDIDEQYNLRVYKYPDGEIKKKYTFNIRHIRDIQIDFAKNDQLWQNSVFSIDNSIFATRANRTLCVTVVGSAKWGQIYLINIEFEKEADKLLFYQCISQMIYLFKA